MCWRDIFEFSHVSSLFVFTVVSHPLHCELVLSLLVSTSWSNIALLLPGQWCLSLIFFFTKFELQSLPTRLKRLPAVRDKIDCGNAHFHIAKKVAHVWNTCWRHSEASLSFALRINNSLEAVIIFYNRLQIQAPEDSLCFESVHCCRRLDPPVTPFNVPDISKGAAIRWGNRPHFRPVL